jgi:dTDP-4-dehydrorhamnose reductase
VILLTGATGQVGTALRPLLADLDEVVAPARAAFDLATPLALPDLLDRWRPTVVVNCAAWTDVDAAETHEDVATTVNGTAVATLATWAADNDAWLLTLSSDYVFPGTGDRPLLEDDVPDPVNAYGRSKLVGEQAAVASGAALVVRTSWLLSATHPNFVRTILALLARGEDPAVVDDQHGSPTIVADLARALADLLARRPVGILHLANSGATTWWGLAREAARLAGFDATRVHPVATTDRPPRLATRPAWSVLGSSRIDALGIPPLPAWQDSLPQVVAGAGHRAHGRAPGT